MFSHPNWRKNFFKSVMRVGWGQVKHLEGRLGLVLGSVFFYEKGSGRHLRFGNALSHLFFAYPYNINIKYTRQSLGRKGMGMAFPWVPIAKALVLGLVYSLETNFSSESHSEFDTCLLFRNLVTVGQLVFEIQRPTVGPLVTA